MTDDFDFIKAFADVDVLQVEAVGVVVGRAIGALTKGMIEAGVSERSARLIVGYATAELFKVMRESAPPSATGSSSFDYEHDWSGETRDHHDGNTYVLRSIELGNDSWPQVVINDVFGGHVMRVRVTEWLRWPISSPEAS